MISEGLSIEHQSLICIVKWINNLHFFICGSTIIVPGYRLPGYSSKFNRYCSDWVDSVFFRCRIKRHISVTTSGKSHKVKVSELFVYKFLLTLLNLYAQDLVTICDVSLIFEETSYSPAFVNSVTDGLRALTDCSFFGQNPYGMGIFLNTFRLHQVFEDVRLSNT
jgi:hypothetical protein